MKIKKTIGERAFNLFNILFMLSMMFIMIFPIWHILMASFSDSNEILRNFVTGKLMVLPKGFSTDAYEAVMKNPNIIRGYIITLFVVVVGTLSSVLVTTLGAYGLSRKGVMFNGAVSRLIVFTMVFSGGTIPSYIINNNILHLGNNLLILILPFLVSQYNLIVMRTSFAAIPESLIESARIDGANDFTILFRIVVPTSKAIIAVILLFYGVAHWNSWLAASIYLRDPALKPLQLVLRDILLQNSTSSMTASAAVQDRAAIGESIKYATIVVSTLPILCVYPFLQKYFVKGVMVGSVKG